MYKSIYEVLPPPQTTEEKLDELILQTEEICNKHDAAQLSEWLDNQDVCLLLNISNRTLQSYRDRGIIGFCQIGHKMYYKRKDIEEFLNKRLITK